jgi:hypothetical protein
MDLMRRAHIPWIPAPKTTAENLAVCEIHAPHTHTRTTTTHTERRPPSVLLSGFLEILVHVVSGRHEPLSKFGQEGKDFVLRILSSRRHNTYL